MVSAEVTVVRAGKLIDGSGGEPTENVSIVMRDGRISEVVPNSDFHADESVAVLDASKHTVLPGLIDCHIHLIKANVRYFKNYQLATLVTHPTLLQLYGLRSAQIMLEAGFTTVKNQPHFMPWEPRSELYGVAIKKAIDVGLLPGPRMKTGGYAHITNGHFDYATPPSLPRFSGVTADGPWELRKMVREILRGGADFIKTALSGGAGTSEEVAEVRNMTQDEINAVVDEAHAFGKTVSAHCFSAATQKMALVAGVDVLEHCVDTDAEAIEMMLKQDCPIVPTLAHRSDKAIELRATHGAPPNVIDKMRSIQERCWKSFQSVRDAGVTIAMGTDTQIDPMVGDSAEELAIYVDLGMTPMEAIVSATSHAAKAMHMPDVGRIAPGMLADLIIFDGDPLSDIQLLQDKRRILQVVKGGVVAVDRQNGREGSILIQPEFVKGEY